MPRKAVYDAVHARLEGARLTAPWAACKIFEANKERETPKDGSPFILVQFPASSAGSPVLERFFREEGGIRIVIHVESGTGVSQGLSWADDIATLFRSRRFGGVETKVPTSTPLDDGNDAAVYFRVSVVVPYTFNFRD